MLLDVDTENDFNFEKSEIRKEKVRCFNRTIKRFKFDSKKNLIKTFINPQFGYCPLAWMCCERKANSHA